MATTAKTNEYYVYSVELAVDFFAIGSSYTYGCRALTLALVRLFLS